jgi:hypothetical protein
MHRSGTSALTRAISRLGAYGGPDDHLGRHWENRYLRRTNQRLLDAAGGTWDSPPHLDDFWGSPEATRMLPRARETLDNEFGSAPVTIWKDPRTCVTLPFWLRAFDEDPLLVVIYRHPLEVSGSLATRNGLVPGHTLALWERYNADALRFAVGLPTVVMKYGAMLDDPTARMVEVADQIRSVGVDLPNDPRTTDLELDVDARHHEVTDDDLGDPLLTESQRDLFRMLCELEGAHESLELPRALLQPHPLSRQLILLASVRTRGPDVEPRGVSRGRRSNDDE